MVVSSQLHALSPRKDLRVCIEQETGWVPEIFWGVGGQHFIPRAPKQARHFSNRMERISRAFAFVVKGLIAFITACKLTVGRIGTGSSGKLAGFV